MASFESLITSSLKKYKHPDVTKLDILTALSAFGDLRPKFEDFVFNNGSIRQLVQLDGTIPVTYKGNVYNIPICIYLMDTHPYTPPIVFVKPTSTMQIKSGRHVDQNGKIDVLPYLREWKYPNSDLLGLIQILVIVFGDEPPVYSRSQATNQPQPLRYPTQGTPYPPAGGEQMQAPSSSRSISSDADQTTGSDSSTIDDELQELQKLQGLLKCKICKARRVALSFQPCGHCIACAECGSGVRVCPMCPWSGINTRGTVKIVFVP
ncbi:hypothetical protein DPMN_044565 [Dreissena polymorpha]|uniref:Uncharacterized protein n=1 Tax=Dreissena polymorpha TaxID=45954 RepID=A0A9D4I0L9_DREPO|nr:hypothetical protein DPMN_044565 [Dreissena polymorpha]